MSDVNNQNYWKDFFELYRNMPELWDTSCEEYKNKTKKLTSYNRLLNKYREYDADARLDTLKKKLHNIRSSVGRECRKVNRSIQNGYDAETVYKPTLWYYYELSFLRTQDDQELVLNEDEANSLKRSYKPRPVAKCKKQTIKTFKKKENLQDEYHTMQVGISRSNSKEPIGEQCYNSNDEGAEDENITESHMMNDWSSDADDINENDSGSFFSFREISDEQLKNLQTSVVEKYLGTNKECEEETDSHSHIEGRAKRKKPNIKQEKPAMCKKADETDPLNVENTSDNLSIPFSRQDNRRDEAQIYAEGWATSYRKLSKSQKIMARKAIEEIFFLGEMEQLTPVVVQMPTA